MAKRFKEFCNIFRPLKYFFILPMTPNLNLSSSIYNLSTTKAIKIKLLFFLLNNQNFYLKTLCFMLRAC